MNTTHNYEQLISLFDGCFAEDFNTRLVKGDDEPVYLPADADVPITALFSPMATMPAPCMKFLTGASPEKRVANRWILVTGTARTGAMRKPSASSKTLR